MADELKNAIVQLQTYLRSLKGIKGAPDYPPDQMSAFPFSICYPGTGEVSGGETGKKGMHNIAIELHLDRTDLARAVEQAVPYGDSVPELLLDKFLHDNKWNRTISTFRSISYEFGPLNYNGVPTIGWKFTVNDVKIQNAIA